MDFRKIRGKCKIRLSRIKEQIPQNFFVCKKKVSKESSSVNVRGGNPLASRHNWKLLFFRETPDVKIYLCSSIVSMCYVAGP